MKKYISIALAAALAVLLPLLLGACAPSANYISDSFFAMDTVIEIKLAAGTKDSDALFGECRGIIEKYDNILSAENGASEIARFNMSGSGCAVSRELGELFESALDLYRMTDGMFDPTTYPSTLLWRGAEAADRLPDSDEIVSTADKRGMELISYDSANGMLVKSEPWIMLDPGGIGKGFAEAAVLEFLEASDAGYGVLSFGGNISVFGEHPAGKFTIALREPIGNGHAAEVKLTSGFISVSGGYERYYEIGGDRYCHIIAPSSGMPADGTILSVSVISSNGTAADALSTALFVAETPEEAERLYFAAMDTAYEFEAVLIYENEIYITPGLEDSFTLSCERALNIIGK
ncbi:membrane-associated lipoprotein [Anaerotruncus sp. CAG:390]|nr:membrane-associated lipoprotein [Anaerotruncus sp. CAG:390]